MIKELKDLLTGDATRPQLGDPAFSLVDRTRQKKVLAVSPGINMWKVAVLRPRSPSRVDVLDTYLEKRRKDVEFGKRLQTIAREHKADCLIASPSSYTITQGRAQRSPTREELARETSRDISAEGTASLESIFDAANQLNLDRSRLELCTSPHNDSVLAFSVPRKEIETLAELSRTLSLPLARVRVGVSTLLEDWAVEHPDLLPDSLLLFADVSGYALIGMDSDGGFEFAQAHTGTQNAAMAPSAYIEKMGSQLHNRSDKRWWVFDFTQGSGESFQFRRALVEAYPTKDDIVNAPLRNEQAPEFTAFYYE